MQSRTFRFEPAVVRRAIWLNAAFVLLGTASAHGQSGYGSNVYVSDEFTPMGYEFVGDGDTCPGGCAVDGCTPTCSVEDAACCQPCPPLWAHRTGVFGEFLYLQATGVDMVHAQQQDGTGGAGTVPFGKIAATDPDYEPAFRVGGVIARSDCSSVALSYTHYESDSVDSVVAPFVSGGGGAVGSLVHHPGAAITASPGPVTGAYGIDFQLADYEYRRLLLGDNCGWLNYSVGGRYAHLEQDFLQSGLFGGGSAGVINTMTDIEFDGGGATFGLDGEYVVGRRGFSVYSSIGVAPVVGQFSTHYDMYNESTDAYLALAEWKDDRFVTILDLEVGVAWTGPCRRWRFSAGYVASFWYNVITTAEFIDAVQANNYTDVGDTLSFDGLSARIERRF